MSRLARTTAAAVLSLSLAGNAFAQDTAATPAAPDAASAATADTVLATVNGQPITLGHMIALAKDLPEQYQKLPDDVLFDGILEQLIQQTVLSAELTDPTPLEQLSIDNQERALKAGLVVQRTVAGDVSEEAIQKAYDAQYASAAPETEYSAAHILVKTEDEAKAIEEELKNGGDFAAIAKEKSQDPGSAANGGDLGWFGKGMMVPEFETAVTSTPPGEISAPVQSQFGWHIIKVNETREKDKPTLDSVRQELTEKVRNDTVEAVIKAAMDKADVKREAADTIDRSALRKTELIGQ